MGINKRPPQRPDTKAPESSEYRQPAIDKAINKRIFEDKLFNVPLTVGPLVALGGLFVFNTGFFVGVGLGLTGFAVGKLSYDWAMNREKYALEYVQSLNVRMKNYLTGKEFELRDEFEKLDHDEMITQMDNIQLKFKTFREVLSLKFTPGEMVFSRYMGAAENVHRACFSNLTNILLAYKALSAITFKEIKRQLKQDIPDDQRRALEKRLEYYRLGEQDIEKMFSLNEQAMTTLDAAIAEIRNVGDDDVNMDVDQAIGDMTELTDIIQEFKPTVL